MRVRTVLIGALAFCAVGVAAIDMAAAQRATPPAGYTINEKYTRKSPDGSVSLEQYLNQETDDWKWLFFARTKDTFALLDREPAGYGAGFVFSNDLKWIVRQQKLGSGTSTLYLYRLTPQGYVAAGKKPFGELAWAYMKSTPDWRKLVKAPEYHETVYLVDGLEENYRGLGVEWPPDRYMVIGLFGAADVRGRKPSQTSVVNGWRCRYDLQTGKFDVPAIFARDNAKALVPPM